MAGSTRAGTDVVFGPSKGFCDATTSTAQEVVNLTSWKGTHVIVQCETEAHYIAFGATSTGTMDVDAATLDTSLVPLKIAAGDIVRLFIPPATPYLYYRTVTGTGILRVIR